MNHLPSVQSSELEALRAERDRLLRRVAELEIDALSGLYLRKVGMERIIRLAIRGPIAFVLIDIDNMKRHNEEGLSRGDWAITLAASAATAACRAGDIAIRWGGDEVGVFFPNGTVSMAESAARRIQHAVRRASGDRVTVSCGHGMLPSNVSTEAVIAAVDDAFEGARKQKAAARQPHAMPTAASHATPPARAIIQYLKSDPTDLDALALQWMNGALPVDRIGDLVAAALRGGRRCVIDVSPRSVAFVVAGNHPEATRILQGESTEAEERSFLQQRAAPLIDEARRLNAGDAGAAARALVTCPELAAALVARSRQPGMIHAE